jgi:hypothetical protein
MKVPPMTLGKCPPGLFMFDGTLCFKSEYKTESQSRPGFWQSDAYVVESGEYFWGGVSDPRERERLEVTPIEDDERYAAGFAAVLAMLPDTAAAGTDAILDHMQAENERKGLFAGGVPRDQYRAAMREYANAVLRAATSALADAAGKEGE